MDVTAPERNSTGSAEPTPKGLDIKKLKKCNPACSSRFLFFWGVTWEAHLWYARQSLAPHAIDHPTSN